MFKAGGNPYGVSATANDNGEVSEDVLAAARYQASRLTTVAQWISQARVGAGV